MSTRPRLHKGMREAILRSDDFTCYICNRRVRTGKRNKARPLGTIDHVIPTSRGGHDDIRNMKTCCEECNRAKDNLLLHELAIMQLTHPCFAW